MLKNFLDWVKSFSVPAVDSRYDAIYGGDKGNLGANIDTRPEDQKQEDIIFAEIVASAMTPIWTIIPEAKWRKFPDFDQASTSGCVAFTKAKIMGILRWLKDGYFVHFSAGHIYKRRSNVGEGMIGSDSFAIGARGVTIDALAPSQNLSEREINSLLIPPVADEVASLFKLSDPKPIVLPAGDIDAAASVMQKTGKPIMVWFYFTTDEWARYVPQVNDNNLGLYEQRTLRHSVTAVGDFFKYNGLEVILIEDSAHFGGLTRRLITREFFKKRNFYSAYPMNLKRVSVIDNNEPIVLLATFDKTLVFIPWNTKTNQPSDIHTHTKQEYDVARLQEVLQKLTDVNGNTYFPVNVNITGYYGALTADAVYRWQSDNKVADQPQLDSLRGRSFGEASRAVMNRELGG